MTGCGWCGGALELEKTKGNESFRVADNQEAVSCYSRSLAYNPQSAVVWANRAMAYIRLELFDLAEADSSVALLLDPSYVKAYSRRGLVRFKRGKYAQVGHSPLLPHLIVVMHSVDALVRHDLTGGPGLPGRSIPGPGQR